MTNGLVKSDKNELFPYAKVPDAKTIQDVFDAWENVGLIPLEVSTADLQQRIYITHDSLTGKIKWQVEKMDGIQALGIMATIMFSMFEYFFKALDRPKFSSGNAKLAVYLKDNQLTVGLEPKYDPTVVKGIAAAALWELITRAGGDDPIKEWLDMFIIEQNS